MVIILDPHATYQGSSWDARGPIWTPGPLQGKPCESESSETFTLFQNVQSCCLKAGLKARHDESCVAISTSLFPSSPPPLLLCVRSQRFIGRRVGADPFLPPYITSLDSSTHARPARHVGLHRARATTVASPSPPAGIHPPGTHRNLFGTTTSTSVY